MTITVTAVLWATNTCFFFMLLPHRPAARVRAAGNTNSRPGVRRVLLTRTAGGSAHPRLQRDLPPPIRPGATAVAAAAAAAAALEQQSADTLCGRPIINSVVVAVEPSLLMIMMRLIFFHVAGSGTTRRCAAKWRLGSVFERGVADACELFEGG